MEAAQNTAAMAEKQQEHNKWSLQNGQYLGEISALCFLHLSSHLSSLPYLLAGSGSQVLLYNLEAGRMLQSFQVFDGVRVHGISCSFAHCSEGSSSVALAYRVVVYGEKRVKLFNLSFELVSRSQSDPGVRLNLSLVHSLPSFNHWVLDVLFLKGCTGSSDEGSHCLAIGCSDNSICIWDVSKSSVILEVQSPERCLLYSMRLWGENIEALRIASGTIYNEIIVWKVISQCGCPSLTNEMAGHMKVSSFSYNNVRCQNQQYKAVHICRLVGHEGSIFRIVWTSDGSKLVSVSDDRSARIWTTHMEQNDFDSTKEVVGPVLFGHNARVWDCCISDNLIVTAGEDCTCRVWGLDGKQLKMIKEHIGRGIWRCLYDPDSSILVTAGFDSAVKVHQLHPSISGTSEEYAEAKNIIDRARICTTQIPTSAEHIGLMDSKSEYVRCLRFKSEDTLYVATNHGYLYCARLSERGDVEWTELVHVSEEVPIVCMDLLSRNLSEHSCCMEDLVALGDGKGGMTIVGVTGDSGFPEVRISLRWSAELERQLLGTYWCRSLGCRYVFTTDPRGVLKLWRLCDNAIPACQSLNSTQNISLIAEFSSCFGIRIMCLDASIEDEVLVCGDLRGNLALFPLSKGLLQGMSATSVMKISPLNYFKGAHGISSVSSISFLRFNCNQVEIHSTGADGCICYLEYDKDRKTFKFIGMKQVKELSLIQSVSIDDLANCNYAAGFLSTDFIVWNLITEAKVLQIPCGGWRRPHSYYLGDVPEIRNCFAYVKDEIIYIHRHWFSESGPKIFPRNLRLQFHGREMHSLCFISENSQAQVNEKESSFDKCSWIATGCEDGTVRLTRFTPEVENWSTSKLLGEHVGGSAVRSICFVSKIHTSDSDVPSMSSRGNSQISATDEREHPCLLISVGAKRVLTSWLLRNRRLYEEEGTYVGHLEKKGGNHCKPCSGQCSSMSFQWLSTDMPTKNSSTQGRDKMASIVSDVSSLNNDAKTRSSFPEKEETESKSFLLNKYEDDWRYLAVTAFLVKCAGSRLSVCFIVVACSDASLSLRALILPHRLWFDVALLVPMRSPVLALQHIVIRMHLPSEDNMQIGSMYIVISGATDGSIALWDITENVEAFMLWASSLHVETFNDCQKRPRTGRGSQGGRWRRLLNCSISNQSKKGFNGNLIKKVGDGANHKLLHATCGASTDLCDMETSTIDSPQVMHDAVHELKSLRNNPQAVNDASLESNWDSVNSFPGICEIQPIQVMNNVHQSGVNCLHVSDVDCQKSDYGFMFNVVSGGDDQAIHCFRFRMSLPSTGPDTETMKSTNEFESNHKPLHHTQNQNRKCWIILFDHHKIASAHSSAIKGIWTDATWVFSTGLDQRIRCWLFEEHGKLTEHAHLVISVPEPEALDARACGRNHYQIVVAGRGMQMIEFSADLH